MVFRKTAAVGVVDFLGFMDLSHSLDAPDRVFSLFSTIDNYSTELAIIYVSTFETL